MLKRFSELGDDVDGDKRAQFSAESGRKLTGDKNRTANHDAESGRVGKMSMDKIRTANCDAESGRVGKVSIDEIGTNNWKRRRTSYNPIPIIPKEMRE